MAHHEEIESHCGELLHGHQLAAEGSSELVLGLGDCVVRLQDQVDWEPSTLDPAKFSHLVQHLAEHFQIGVAAMSQSLLRDEDGSAPPMCNRACDSHPRPWL